MTNTRTIKNEARVIAQFPCLSKYARGKGIDINPRPVKEPDIYTLYSSADLHADFGVDVYINLRRLFLTAVVVGILRRQPACQTKSLNTVRSVEVLSQSGCCRGQISKDERLVASACVMAAPFFGNHTLPQQTSMPLAWRLNLLKDCFFFNLIVFIKE